MSYLPTVPAAATPTEGEIGRTVEQNHASVLADRITEDANLLRLASMAQRQLRLSPLMRHRLEESAAEISDRLQARIADLQAFLDSSRHAGPSRPRTVGGVVAALALAVGLVCLPAGAPAAQAATKPVAPAVRVVVSSPEHPVVVLRKSLVTGRVTALPGAALVTGTVKHWDATSRSWRGDQASPVLVQALELGHWVTPATVTTAPDGSVAAYVALSEGVQVLRLVRPAGATVTGGASALMPVVVPEALPAGDI